MRATLTKLISVTLIGITGLSNFALAQWVAVTSPSKNNPVNCIGRLGSSIFAGLGNSQGIMRSDDNAITWIPVNTGLPNNPAVGVYSFAVIGNTIFAVVAGAGNAFGSIYMSTNSGASWAKTPSTIFELSYCAEIASSGNDLYAAITGGAGVYKSSDYGASWIQVGQGIANGGPLLVNGSAIYAGLSISVDNGASWKAIPNPGVSVSSSVVIGSIFFIGDSAGKGVFHTSDNGLTWNRDTVGLKVQTIYHMALFGSTLYVGTYGGGVYKSINQGSGWVADNGGIDQFSTISTCFGKSATNLFWASNGGNLYKKSNLSYVLENNLSETFSVYPNPSMGKFSIAFENNNQNNNVEIFNLIGENILVQQNRSEIDISSASKGIYFAKISIGGNICIKKLIVQ
jgi:photosystem II stability/assembly factor-like uncharacterized protein